MKKKVFILDDDLSIRKGLKDDNALLSNFTIYTENNVKSAISSISKLQKDNALIDHRFSCQ